jgi:hypothetical protein
MPSEFERWCFENKRQSFTDRVGNISSLPDFLMQKELIVSLKDSPIHPGLDHAAMLSLEILHPCKQLIERPPMSKSPYSDLSDDQREMLMEIINRKLAPVYMADEFNIGQAVGDNWKIQSILVGSEGRFNGGIYLVQDMHDPKLTTCVMRLLPT